MTFHKLANEYLAVYEKAKNQLNAAHSRKMTRKYMLGKTALSPEQKKQVKAFYAPYKKITPLFHAFFLEKTGEFHPEHIPNDLYYTKIDPYFNPENLGRALDNKCLYSRLFPGIAQAETIVCRMAGMWFDAGMQQTSWENAAALLDKQSAVFVKVASASCGGKGVHYIDGEAGSIAKQLQERIKPHVDIVVQVPFRQHTALAALHKSSVNTLRLLSVLLDGEVTVYSSIVRMGAGNSKVDNASSGGITCGIDENGCLKKYAYKPSGERFKAHPTSGVVFDGYQIPGFEKAKELVLKAHPLVPHFGMVSWDVAIDEKGDAVMIEANLQRGELDFHQLNNGPLFGKDTKKILDKVFGKKEAT